MPCPTKHGISYAIPGQAGIQTLELMFALSVAS